MTTDRPSGDLSWLPNVGHKEDAGKARWSLLHWPLLRGMAEIMTSGAVNHGEYGFLTMPDAHERYFNALMRHVAAYKMGERVDPDDGKPTLYHIACNVNILAAIDEHGRKTDQNP